MYASNEDNKFSYYRQLNDRICLPSQVDNLFWRIGCTQYLPAFLLKAFVKPKYAQTQQCSTFSLHSLCTIPDVVGAKT